MNKKYLVFGLPILAIGLVMAGVMAYYGSVQQTVDVKQSVIIEGCNEDNVCTENVVEAWTGDTFYSDTYTLKNLADTSRTVDLVTTYPYGDEDEVSTGYYQMETLELTKKTVAFGETPWVVLDGLNDKVQIEYTVVGDKFLAIAKPHSTPEKYVLIYYADAVDRFAYPEKAILVEAVEGSLPYNTDANVAMYDYCTIEGYETCNGAKIWYVPESAINEDETLNWSRVDEFYFETDLITYTEGNINPITLEGESSIDFVIVNTINELSDGVNGLIETEVLPTA